MSTFVLVHGMSHGGRAPQPFTPWVERVDSRRFFAMRVPCTYIRCLRDAAVTPARAAEYAARLGVAKILESV